MAASGRNATCRPPSPSHPERAGRPRHPGRLPLRRHPPDHPRIRGPQVHPPASVKRPGGRHTHQGAARRAGDRSRPLRTARPPTVHGRERLQQLDRGRGPAAALPAPGDQVTERKDDTLTQSHRLTMRPQDDTLVMEMLTDPKAKAEQAHHDGQDRVRGAAVPHAPHPQRAAHHRAADRPGRAAQPRPPRGAFQAPGVPRAPLPPEDPADPDRERPPGQHPRTGPRDRSTHPPQTPHRQPRPSTEAGHSLTTSPAAAQPPRVRPRHPCSHPAGEHWESFGRGFTDIELQNRAMLALHDALEALIGKDGPAPRLPDPLPPVHAGGPGA